MRIALSGMVLCVLLRSAAACEEACRLEVKGSGKAIVTRQSACGDLSIEIPGDFKASANVIHQDGAWLAGDAEVTVTILAQEFHLRLTTLPDEQVSIEVNDTPVGSGSRDDLGVVPLLGAPVALGSGKPRDYGWRIEFKPRPGAKTSETRIALRAPDGDELLGFKVRLASQETPDAGRPWTASSRHGPVELPARGNQTVVINRLMWSGEGRVGASRQPFTASVSVKAEFVLPGGARGTFSAEAEATLARTAADSG